MKPQSVRLLASLLIASVLTMISGCAATSAPTPLVGKKVQLTPLPASVTQIAPSSSEPILTKLSTFRVKLKRSYGSATTK